MTATGTQAPTAVGLRVTFLRMGVMTSEDPSSRDSVSLSTLHDTLGLLDEFCSIVNLAWMLEEGAFDDATLSELKGIHSLRKIDPDHAEVLVKFDSATRAVVAPIVRRVSMNSPLVIELIGSLSAGALFLLKNPGRIGSWIPTVREHWFQAQAEAERAKRAYRALTEVGIKVEELED